LTEPASVPVKLYVFTVNPVKLRLLSIIIIGSSLITVAVTTGVVVNVILLESKVTTKVPEVSVVPVEPIRPISPAGPVGP
jgi:hypothetical protein